MCPYHWLWLTLELTRQISLNRETLAARLCVGKRCKDLGEFALMSSELFMSFKGFKARHTEVGADTLTVLTYVFSGGREF